MTAPHEDVPGSGWRKLAALVLCVVAIGLPISNISDYALLVILAVVIFSGDHTHRRSRMDGRRCDRGACGTGAGTFVAAAHSGRAQCLFAEPGA